MKLELSESEYAYLCECVDLNENSYIEIKSSEDNPLEKSVEIDCYSKIKDIVDRKTDLKNIDSEIISDILWQIQAEFDFVNSIVDWNFKNDFMEKIIGIFSAELKKRQ